MTILAKRARRKKSTLTKIVILRFVENHWSVEFEANVGFKMFLFVRTGTNEDEPELEHIVGFGWLSQKILVGCQTNFFQGLKKLALKKQQYLSPILDDVS